MPQRRRLSLGARTPMCSYFMRSPVDELGLMCDVSSDLRRVRRRTKPSYGSSYPADGAQAVILIGVTSRGKGALSQTGLHEAKTTPSLNLRLCTLGSTCPRMRLFDKVPILRDGRDTNRCSPIRRVLTNHFEYFVSKSEDSIWPLSDPCTLTFLEFRS